LSRLIQAAAKRLLAGLGYDLVDHLTKPANLLMWWVVDEIWFVGEAEVPSAKYLTESCLGERVTMLREVLGRALSCAEARSGIYPHVIDPCLSR
jgi:hypothetical protein